MRWVCIILLLTLLTGCIHVGDKEITIDLKEGKRKALELKENAESKISNISNENITIKLPRWER